MCMKIQALGWQILYVPESSLVHHDSQSGPELLINVWDNISLFTKRWKHNVPEKEMVRT
ncbi:MAG: hypothetical protein ACYCUF_03600 [Acidimicrobiales bacterium]|nr:hypothetical protein [Actinomycetota bacterium]